LIGGALRRIAAQWHSISLPDKRREAPLIVANKLRAKYLSNLHGLYGKPLGFSRQLNLLCYNFSA
jgi:hypothetical protein